MVTGVRRCPRRRAEQTAALGPHGFGGALTDHHSGMCIERRSARRCQEGGQEQFTATSNKVYMSDINSLSFGSALRNFNYMHDDEMS